jgi:hypothetical protein
MEWDWETGQWYPKEPVPAEAQRRRQVSPAGTRNGELRPVQPVSESSRERDPGRPAEAADEAGTDSVEFADEARADAADAVQMGFYRLHLVSGPEAASISPRGASDSIACVKLIDASAEQVGRLLAELYPPLGPGGTEHRYYLVYQSPALMKAAARLAAQLDLWIERLPTGPHPGPAEAFGQAVPLYYELVRRGGDSALAKEVVGRFDLAAGSAEVADRLRWVAAMTAARVRADYLADAEGQAAALRAAREVVPGNSLESFLAGAMLVQCYDRNGMTIAAENLAKELAVQFQAFRATGPYQDCIRVAKRGVR